MYQPGDIVRYKVKNEIGLVSETIIERRPNGARKLWCWWHLGGTRSAIDFSEVERVTLQGLLTTTYANEYAKASLLERQLRVLEEDGPVDDLIEGDDIRPFITELLEKANIKEE